MEFLNAVEWIVLVVLKMTMAFNIKHRLPYQSHSRSESFLNLSTINTKEKDVEDLKESVKNKTLQEFVEFFAYSTKISV